MRFLWGTYLRNRISWYHILDFLPLSRPHFQSFLTMMKPSGDDYFKTQIEKSDLFKRHDKVHESEQISVCTLPMMKTTSMIAS